jgi:hypothetical protein
MHSQAVYRASVHHEGRGSPGVDSDAGAGILVGVVTQPGLPPRFEGFDRKVVERSVAQSLSRPTTPWILKQRRCPCTTSCGAAYDDTDRVASAKRCPKRHIRERGTVPLARWSARFDGFRSWISGPAFTAIRPACFAFQLRCSEGKGESTIRRELVAVLGCGYWGKNLVRNFAQLGSLAMADPTPVGWATAAEIAPTVEMVADIDDVLSSPVAGVVIATPAETHFDLTRQALEAGKDVFVEKPLALTYEQGERLVRLAGQLSRILMVGHVLEYHPAVVRHLDLAREGRWARSTTSIPTG